MYQHYNNKKPKLSENLKLKIIDEAKLIINFICLLFLNYLLLMRQSGVRNILF